MKFVKLLIIYTTLLSAALSGAVLTDDFESGSKNGWTDSGTTLVYYGSPVNSNVLRIDYENSWKSKVYDFGTSNANKTVQIEFDMWAIGRWESGTRYTDYFYVKADEQMLVDGETIPGADGNTEYVYHHFSLTATLDGNGRVELAIMYDVSAPGEEKALIDNITLVSEGTILARDDNYTTPSDNPLTDNVLTNDIGINLQVTSFTLPANGSLSMLPDGNFTYIPNSGYLGSDSFTYTITDENNLSDSATVTISISTAFSSGEELPFYIVNPPASRNLVGDYKIAGNTVLCLTEKTDGYGGTCHGDTDYQDITSNMNVTKYLDIDGDSSTWNSTSSYIELPDTYDPATGVVWAGLFWQGRISVDKDHPIHYAVENGSSYDFIEVGEGTTIGIGDFDIRTTGALDIKLKVNSGSYNDIIANTFHVYESSNGQTYAAFANVTSVFSSNLLSPGKNTFTVANLTTMEGREPSPGAFGGWTLVVIYAEDYTQGKPKNISIYNGFISIGTDNSPIEISGFRLPEAGPIKAQLSVFSGEGEYRYGRTPYNNAVDWMKISDTQDSGYDYMPGLEAGTQVGNRDNMFDARLDNILRDDIVNGVDNNLSTNNVGVDVDNYDVSELMETYRNTNPYVNTVYIQMYSNNDYITPSMMAFSAELYEPAICYDYTFDIDGYVLESAENDINTTLHLAAPDKPLRTHLLIRSLEGDFALNDAELTVSVVDPTMLTYIDGSTALAIHNINEYEPADTLVHDVTNAGFSLYFGEGATETQGGVLNANQSNYILFDYETNASKPRLETAFLFDVNFTVDYGSGPVTIYKHLDANSRCPTSTLYAPEWGIFNIISDITDPNSYSLVTQASNRAFDVHGIYYDSDYTTPKPITTDIEVELINANFFKSDTNASCNNPDSNITVPVFANFSNSSTTAAISNNPDFAMRNSAFRIWYLENNESKLVKNTCGSRTNESCYKTLYDTEFAAFDTLCTTACDGTKLPGTCYRCLRKHYGKPLCSRDNFSIRPETFRISIADQNNGSGSIPITIHQNDTILPVSLAADYNYTLSASATQYGSDTPAKKYIQAYGGGFPAGPIEENATKAGLISQFPAGYVCNNAENRAYSIVFWNGQTAREISHNDVGDYRLFIRDSEWTKVDNPGRWGQDCVNYPNSGYKEVPSGGMIGCVISSEYDASHTDINAIFKAYEFDMRDIKLTAPNSSFIYMNMVTDDYTMSIRVKGQIVAKGKNGATLTNFSDQCYGKDIDLTFSRMLQPDESTLSAPALLRYYDITSDYNNTTDMNDTDKIGSHRFQNGISIANLAINIDKNSSIRVNPIELNISEIKVTCSNQLDCQTYADQQPNHDAEGNKTYPAGTPFHRFVYYGRLHAPDYRTEKDSIPTPIYAEVYCDPILVNCEDFNITRANGWKESVDDVNWWINPLHTTADGNITELSAKLNFSSTYDSTITINGANPYSAFNHAPTGGSYAPTVTYTGGKKPYRTRIHVKTEKWLQYHRFFTDGRLYYDVLFEGAAGNWAGIGNAGKSVDTNASGSSSRRIEW